MAARKCLICGGSMAGFRSTKAKCCSKDCSVKWQNTKRAEERRAQGLADRQPCQHCGGPISDDRRFDSLYCSLACKKAVLDARWREKSPGYMRQYLYGVTPEQYETLMMTQGNACAICRSTEWKGKGNRPHVDHNHKTGAVRGLLCGPCNTGLGQFGDDPARLLAAVEYLRSAEPI
jgi:hypothetical protein